MMVVMKPTSTLLADRGLQKNGKVQVFVDGEVLRRCDPMVPMDTGALIGSGITATTLGSGEVKYNTVYARRWYYCAANFQGAPTRGNYWFERMKNSGGKEAILRGAAAVAGGRAGG